LGVRVTTWMKAQASLEYGNKQLGSVRHIAVAVASEPGFYGTAETVT
jgi:hypothetical protein